VTFPANSNSNPTTGLRWKDVQVIVKSVTTSGTRLSPDYFICTQRGRAILCKVADKDGLFVEWTREIDTTRKTPDAGVYYMNIDYVNEETRDVGLTVQKYLWVEGKGVGAQGSIVVFRPDIIDPSTGQNVDLSTLIATDPTTSTSVIFNASNSSFGGTITIVTPCTKLWLTFSNGQALIPNTDYWYERAQSTVICQSTLGGAEVIGIPDQYVSVTFTDQSGYELRPNLDYRFYGSPQFIQLSQYSPPGSKITANMQVKLNPYSNSPVNPENTFNIGMQPNQSLAPNQVFIHTSAGDYDNPIVNADGSITLPVLLQPGEWYRYEARINAGLFKAVAKKWEINSLVVVDPNTIEYVKLDANKKTHPVPNTFVANADASQMEGVIQASAGKPLLDSTGARSYVLPGLWLAFGDMAVVGDQAAVIISPSLTETYQVYGSKENLTFTLEIKSNDLQTSSDLAEMIKQYLLITSRKNVEADGLTIFEATRDFVGEARDPSGTASNFIVNLTVSASADWKLYKPLVTRLVSFEITDELSSPDFLGKLTTTPRISAFGSTVFIPMYS